MRTLLSISFIFALFAFNPSRVSAQSDSGVAEINFEVTGVCKMCKKRIENAALVKGVKFVEWEKSTQNLKVIFKPSKVTPLDIHKAINNAGHDTALMAAPDDKYQELPGCCRYRDGIKVH